MLLRIAVHAIRFAAWLSPIVTEKQVFLFFYPRSMLEIFRLCCLSRGFSPRTTVSSRRVVPTPIPPSRHPFEQVFLARDPAYPLVYTPCFERMLASSLY